MGKYKVEICNLNTTVLPVLENEEMIHLFKDYQKGNLESKEKLVLGNLKLVLSITQRFSHRVDNMDDLFQIGCVGLIKAIEHFDLSHQVKFSTYAVPMIMGEMKRYLRDNQMIRVSRNLKEIAYKTLKAKEKFLHQFHYEPSIKQLSDLLKIEEKEIVEALESIQNVLSIFEPISQDDSEPLYLLDQIQDKHNEIEKMQNQLCIKDGLKKLSKKEKEIIIQRYYADKTQVEIAMEMGISQAQVSRLEKSALQSLKKNM